MSTGMGKHFRVILLMRWNDNVDTERALADIIRTVQQQLEPSRIEAVVEVSSRQRHRTCRAFDPGWVRIGRYDRPRRRSLWVRTAEDGTIELCAGREGDDSYTRIEPDEHMGLRDIIDTQTWMVDIDDDETDTETLADRLRDHDIGCRIGDDGVGYCTRACDKWVAKGRRCNLTGERTRQDSVCVPWARQAATIAGGVANLVQESKVADYLALKARIRELEQLVVEQDARDVTFIRHSMGGMTFVSRSDGKPWDDKYDPWLASLKGTVECAKEDCRLCRGDK
jgi:hypothetical protein